jgi:hypothetical protein
MEAKDVLAQAKTTDQVILGTKAEAAADRTSEEHLQPKPHQSVGIPVNLPNKNFDLAAVYSTSNDRKDGSKNTAENDWKKLQESRTLDQFYYHSLTDTRKRDENQVVTRYINKVHGENHTERSTWEILRVDQLWLWVVDESTCP